MAGFDLSGRIVPSGQIPCGHHSIGDSAGVKTKLRADRWQDFGNRCAGIDLGGWINHNSNVASGKFRKMSDPAQAFRGCIGVEDGINPGGRNHHFIVMQNSEGTISSIDGNSFGPINGDFGAGVKSVIAPKTYSHQKLKHNSAYFLFPNLA